MQYPLEQHAPKVDPSAYVAPGAHVIGQVTIGERSSVWFNCVLRGDSDSITIGQGALIGMGAIVMNRAEIGEYAWVAAGALVPEGKKIPPRMLAVGSPAKLVRELTDEEVEGLKRTALGYQERARKYLEAGIVGRQD